MNLEEYRQASARTFKQLRNSEENDLHVKLGIATEIGELLDVFKKWLAYDIEFDYINASEEIADCMFYQVNTITLEDGKVNQERFNFWHNEFLEGYSENNYVDIPKLNGYELKIKLANIISDYPWCKDEVERDMALLYLIANSLEINFYKALENNVNKLKVRYPNKFNSTDAINRDLEQERKELEK